MAKMEFSIADMYPGLAGYYETTNLTNPDAKDQEGLAENVEAGQQAGKESRPKYIFIALLVVVLLVVFFGAN